MDSWMVEVLKEGIEDDPRARKSARDLMKFCGWPQEEIDAEIPHEPHAAGRLKEKP